MSRLSLDHRLSRLEQHRGYDLPLYIRAWLGQDLTPEQRAIADDEWAQAQAQPTADPDTFDSETRAWLSSRGMAA